MAAVDTLDVVAHLWLKGTHFVSPCGLIGCMSKPSPIPTCPIPDVCIDERRLPLFIARATLRDLIAGLEARATCGAAQ